MAIFKQSRGTKPNRNRFPENAKMAFSLLHGIFRHFFLAHRVQHTHSSNAQTYQYDLWATELIWAPNTSSFSFRRWGSRDFHSGGSTKIRVPKMHSRVTDAPIRTPRFSLMSTVFFTFFNRPIRLLLTILVSFCPSLTGTLFLLLCRTYHSKANTLLV